MSYNIDSCEMLTNENLRITTGDVRRILIQLEEDFPEDNFFIDLEKRIKKLVKSGESLNDEAELPIKKLTWAGEGSGYLFKTFLEKVVPFLRGSADVIFIWEGGDSISGLRIVDGVATKHEVIKSLGAKL